MRRQQRSFVMAFLLLAAFLFLLASVAPSNKAYNRDGQIDYPVKEAGSLKEATVQRIKSASKAEKQPIETRLKNKPEAAGEGVREEDVGEESQNIPSESYCLNGGTPYKKVRCRCPADFFGNFCEHELTCENGGTPMGNATCYCPEGYCGQTCDDKWLVDYCNEDAASTASSTDCVKHSPAEILVHVDLKGAPPRVEYFNELLQFISKCGATGVVIEWEDMFPYSDALSVGRNGYAYSESQTNAILQQAKDLHLKVIPLVQTFGHMEWLLKLKQFASLRDNPTNPQAICAGKVRAWALVRLLLDQVATVHKRFGLDYVHIGGDEVFELGFCNETKVLLTKFDERKEKVVLWQMARIAKYLRKTHNVKVMAWDDMIARTFPREIDEFRLTDLIEPMIWSYHEDIDKDRSLDDSVWKLFKKFPQVWAAGAFKGANRPIRLEPNAPRYIHNQISWLQQMNRRIEKDKIKFGGILLTGWSRFDHFGSLCEILPVGIPSLAMNLRLLSRRNFSVNSMMQCTVQPDLLSADCQFPGANIYYDIVRLAEIKKSVAKLRDTNVILGWFSEASMRQNLSSRFYVERNLPHTMRVMENLEAIDIALGEHISMSFYPDVATEISLIHVMRDLEFLSGIVELSEIVNQKNTFLPRPYF